MSATDSDVGINAQISYSLSGELPGEAGTNRDEFVINAHTGAITTNKLLDRETMSGMYNLDILLFLDDARSLFLFYTLLIK